MPVINDVFADIGDEQDLLNEKSTFSSHLMNIKDFAGKAHYGSLILLDELGTGTDPMEGGALAAAILDFFRNKGAWVVVTSHLNMLKAYAYSHSRVINGAVLFDQDTHRPTYHIHYGTPGLSNALAIADGLGLPEEVISAARGYLSGEDSRVIDLTHLLEKKLLSLDEELRETASLKAKARELTTTLERWLDTARANYNQMVKDFRDESRRMISQAREEIALVSKKLIKIKQTQDVSSAVQTVRQTEEMLEKAFPVPVEPQEGESPESLQKGQAVRFKGSRGVGRVEEVFPEDHKAVVSVGSARVRASFNDLLLVPGAESSIRKQKTETRGYFYSSHNEMKNEINIRGLRVEEALDMVDKFIDNGLLAGLNSVQIIHGKGTGKLKEAVGEYLKKHRGVKRIVVDHPELQNPGVTIAELQD